MDTGSAGLLLTARERQVARLIGKGLTNRQIAETLSISERTVGAHVQNILNKLGANNRAQIAVWSIQATSTYVGAGYLSESLPTDMVVPTAATRRPTRPWVASLISASAVALLLVINDGAGSQSTVPNLGTPFRGMLVYEPKLAGDGEGFTVRTVIGDPSASAIRFGNGDVEYSVIKPGGNTGNRLAMAPMKRFFVEVELAVMPASDVEFWLTLTGHANGHIEHLISLRTRAEAFQLAYFSEPEIEYLGPQVPVPELQLGRRFRISALVDPPHFQVWLDGRSVINLQHAADAPYRVAGFGIFGDQTGAVRLSAVRVFSVA
jgi:DNA-binding CsgD family transcriptional regulator